MKDILFVIAGIATVGIAPLTAGAGEGEIIILREVPPRPAYRQGVPGPVVSKVNASPSQQVFDGLEGTAAFRELSDEEIALIGGEQGLAGTVRTMGVTPATLHSLGVRTGGLVPGGASGVLGGMNALIGGAGVGGSVSQATQGIDKTVNGMLGSLPIGGMK